MNKKDWPLRWDLLLRYRLIEIIALWEGRLTTNHLCDTFGIGRQQASKDINEYLRTIAPGNLKYDKHLKGYKPTSDFSPQLTSGAADEYLHLLHRNQELSHTFEQLNLSVANTAVIQPPVRHVRPDIIRPLVQAAREQKRIDVDYVSLTHPDREGRIITPHTLVFTGVRWHVRAFCEKNMGYRDFVLSRFRGKPELLDGSPHGMDKDKDWHTMVTVRLKPDQRLTPAKRQIIAEDYGMERGALRIKTRGPLLQYALNQLQLDPHVLSGKPSAQQIVIDNFDAIKEWLFH
jgi:predicted DNA-binding transcriptional regulator YafY